MMRSKKIFRCFLSLILSVTLLMSVNVFTYAQMYIYGDWNKDTLINSEDLVLLRRFLLTGENEYTIKDLVRSKKRALSFLNEEKFSPCQLENTAEKPLEVTPNKDIALEKLFKALGNVPIISSQVEVGFYTETGDVSVEKTLNAENWELGTVKFSGAGIAKLCIAENCLVTELYIDVKENTIPDAKIERTKIVDRDTASWYKYTNISKYGLCMPFMHGLTITDYLDDGTAEIFTEDKMIEKISVVSSNFDYLNGAFSVILQFNDNRSLELRISGAPTENSNISFEGDTTVSLKKYNNVLYLCTNSNILRKVTVYWTVDYYKFTGNNGNTVEYNEETTFIWHANSKNIPINSLKDLL